MLTEVLQTRKIKYRWDLPFHLKVFHEYNFDTFVNLGDLPTFLGTFEISLHVWPLEPASIAFYRSFSLKVLDSSIGPLRKCILLKFKYLNFVFTLNIRYSINQEHLHFFMAIVTLEFSETKT